MAFSEFETARHLKLLEDFTERYGPKPEIRHKLRWEHQVEVQSIILYEVRPRFMKPGELGRYGFAKATFVKKDKAWKVYWRRASGKWERYPPYPTAETLEEFLSLVLADEHHCFFG